MKLHTLRLLARGCYAHVCVALVVLVLAGCAALPRAGHETAAIASAHPLATAAGQAMLERGGNAFDAAVAVAAALAVVEPYSSGLGGGGFFLLHRASDAREIMVDARETAPAGVKASDYFDARGKPIPGATTRGGTSTAIPGMPAGLVHVATRYGKLPLALSLAPAIRLARDGFPVDARYARIATLRERFLQGGQGTGVFLDGGKAPQPGFVLRQSELAQTLERIAHSGTAGFYEGPVARALVAAVTEAGGAWAEADLRGYKVVERQPVRFTYRGATVTAAALPSAGGIALAQTLGMLERFSLGAIGTPTTDHLVVEALRRAFHDRARYLADSDFVAVPVSRLVSREHALKKSADIDIAHATRSEALGEIDAARLESHHTTHLSVVDNEGNRVAATLTINLLFGAGIVPPGTGVLLNNEMDDFSLRADVPNAFELRGGLANRIEPGKRPLSSMTPAFVEDGKGVLVLGAPGGSRIVSQVLLAILEYVRTPEVDLRRLVSMPRYHHQYWPDRVEIEPESYAGEWRAAMAAKGHEVREARRAWGNMQMVFKARRTGAAHAASDPRGNGVAWY
ncbi:MAG TPA: gamma-glutamyltransferase [Burkholderiales bacterium]|nr:gamma-glutamyltransferase [Burkholderiales bacterium]